MAWLVHKMNKFWTEFLLNNKNLTSHMWLYKHEWWSFFVCVNLSFFFFVIGLVKVLDMWKVYWTFFFFMIKLKVYIITSGKHNCQLKLVKLFQLCFRTKKKTMNENRFKCSKLKSLRYIKIFCYAIQPLNLIRIKYTSQKKQ